MKEKVTRLLYPIKKYLAIKYGRKIKNVILYGSYVRDEATKDSDIDVLIVVDDALNPSEVRADLSDILFDVLLEKGELISVIAVRESFYKSYKSPFLANVKEEGVLV